MKKPADYAFIKRMLKLVETHNVRVLHEPLYAGILMPGKDSATHLKEIQKFLPEELQITIKCDDVFQVANVLAENFDNVIAGNQRFSTIQDGVKVVFNFVRTGKQGSAYYFDDSQVIMHEDIPWVSIPDYLRAIVYNHPTSLLYNTRAELVARYLHGYPEKIESLVPETIIDSFRQLLIDAIHAATKRIDSNDTQ